MNVVQSNPSYNYGLALLRAAMCFAVVLNHFYLGSISFFGGIAVPVFVLMSFFLTKEKFLNGTKKYNKRRIARIVLPQVAWAGLYFSVYKIFEVTGFVAFDKSIGVSDLLWQLFTGHSPALNASMWYQIDLLIITLVFMALIYITKSKSMLPLLLLVGGVSIALQYIGINKYIFEGLRYELRYPLGRLMEILPYAVIGFTLAYIGISKMIDKYRGLFIVGSLLLILIGGIVFHYFGDIITPDGFDYAGIGYIIISIGVFIFAYAVPFFCLPETIKKLISFITRYTLGIYCIHRMIGLSVKTVLGGFNISLNSFVSCVVIYVLSFFICWLMDRIPVKGIKAIIS